MLRRFLYALSGGVLSAGAPAGLLAVRLAQAREPRLSPAAALRALADDIPAYTYVTFATAAVFALFGYTLGRRADALAQIAETDPLTGLPNARALYRRLQHELERYARYRQPLSLLLIDLDRLKGINDRFGHQAGNRSLRAVAEAIRSELRSPDVGARWGGDEFVVVAPNTAGDAALSLAERIRAKAGASTLPWKVTVSIGIATAAGDFPASATSLLEDADAALYDAKRRGRNCVGIGGGSAPGCDEVSAPPSQIM